MKANAMFSIVSIAIILVLLMLQWYVWAAVMLAIALWYGFYKRKWFDDGSYNF
ncbi:hypothetical protein KY328_00990 [Candidatus Woesearchaeota archaeon]|nr:hypothetical protein [Candidatus Woesearchaeota archaeon]MBW3021472.1 hypothetical protein [Candidatus Woesearchaeota archaeon]